MMSIYRVTGGTLAGRRPAARSYYGTTCEQLTFEEPGDPPMLAAQSGTQRLSSERLSVTNCSAYVAREPVSQREYAMLKIETAGGLTGWENAVHCSHHGCSDGRLART